MINLTIPIHNEEETLEEKLSVVDSFLSQRTYCDDLFVVLSNNMSTDATEELARRVASRSSVKTICHSTARKGKGLAIKESWMNYCADQYWFMDLDLSTDLRHLDQLYELLKTSPVVVGSRLLPQSETKRGLKREFVSRAYNMLLRSVFKTRFGDAQCGFKGINHDVRETILPFVRNEQYFFSTELLLIAEKNHYPIQEMPITWREGEQSHINFFKDIPLLLKAMYAYHRRTMQEPYSLRKISTSR